MNQGAIIRSLNYTGEIPRGSAVVFSDESTVKLPTGGTGDRLCGVYSELGNENASDASTGEALPITVAGPAKVCVSASVSAGENAYIKGQTGTASSSKETGTRLIGRFLEDGAAGDYVLVLVQMGE